MKPEILCSLIVNVARGDTPILEYTLPHIIETHKARFSEVVIVVDEKPSEGRILESYPQHSLRELYETLDRVRSRGYEFRQETISYAPEDVQRVYLEWFGHTRITFRCAGGTPIYAFLYGLNIAAYDYCLHLDSDMLIYDPGPTSWIDKAIALLESTPQIMFVNQSWGIQTESVPSPPELPTVRLASGQLVSQVFSSRCFLFSRKKIERAFLPIPDKKHSIPKQVIYRIQRRSPYVALEQMISAALERSNTFRADLDPKCGWNLHAWDKRIFADRRIRDVLGYIEAGLYPVRHTGQYNLNYELFLQDFDKV